MTDEHESILELIDSYVRMGFHSVDQIVELVFDETELDDDADAWVENAVQQTWEKHRVNSLGWSHPTDPEKIKEVFDTLCESGVLALHYYGFENSDIFPVVSQTIAGLKEENYETELVGFCGYHHQNVMIALDPQWKSLAIDFHSLHDDETVNQQHQLDIGKTLCSLLRERNFDVVWDGTLDKKIDIKHIEWLKIYETEDDAWDEYTIYDLID